MRVGAVTHEEANGEDQSSPLSGRGDGLAAWRTIARERKGSRRAQASPPQPQWSAISFETRSWGTLVTSWTVNDGGDGTWTGKADAAKPDLKVHEFAVGSDGFEKLESIVRKLPEPAPNYDPCEAFMTDQPYGNIRLTKGATTIEIQWNAGCMDADYLAFMDILRSANDTVAAWGIKVKSVGEGRSSSGVRRLAALPALRGQQRCDRQARGLNCPILCQDADRR